MPVHFKAAAGVGPWLHKLATIEVRPTFCAKWFNEHFCCFKFANVWRQTCSFV